MIDPTLSASLSMIQAAPCSGWKDVFKRSGLSYIIKALAPEKTPGRNKEKTKRNRSGRYEEDVSGTQKNRCTIAVAMGGHSGQDKHLLPCCMFAAGEYTFGKLQTHFTGV